MPPDPQSPRPFPRLLHCLIAIGASFICLFMAFYVLPLLGGIVHDLCGDRPLPGHLQFALHSWWLYTILAAVWLGMGIYYFRSPKRRPILMLLLFTLVICTLPLFIPLEISIKGLSGSL